MDSIALRTILLWIHALSGAGWVGACACFLIAAGAAGIQTEEGRGFAQRVGPAVNRIGLAAVGVLVATGIVNVFVAGAQRDYRFSTAFLEVLGVKIVLLIVMFLLLMACFRAEVGLESPDQSRFEGASRRMLVLDAAIIATGAIALALGLWLLGS